MGKGCNPRLQVTISVQHGTHGGLSAICIHTVLVSTYLGICRGSDYVRYNSVCTKYILRASTVLRIGALFCNLRPKFYLPTDPSADAKSGGWNLECSVWGGKKLRGATPTRAAKEIGGVDRLEVRSSPESVRGQVWL